ncbi:MAG: hypothetical protein ACLTAX_17315 [Waltera sp.]
MPLLKEVRTGHTNVMTKAHWEEIKESKIYKNGLSAEQIASATDKSLEEVTEIIVGKISAQV